jgi:hypothetical protein
MSCCGKSKKHWLTTPWGICIIGLSGAILWTYLPKPVFTIIVFVMILGVAFKHLAASR